MKPGSRRKGVVVVFVAVSLTALIGVVAVTVDGGLLQVEHRKARAHADAAAMAAACSLFEHYPANKGKDPDNLARNAALTTAASNGLTNDGVNSIIVIHIPPATGPYAGKDGFAEVIVTYYVQRAFSRIWGSAPLPVTARAVSHGAWSTIKAGVLLLDYDDRAALNSQGNGAFTETGAPVIVNSNNPSATVSAGNGSLVASEFYITGGVQVSGGGSLVTTPVANQVFTGTHPTPDPLAYLEQPSKPPKGTMTTTSLGKGNKQYVLTPGSYTNLPNFNTGDIVILQQASTNANGGIFYIDGGGFHADGATITMGTGTGGILLYNAPPANSESHKIQITGNPAGLVNISGLTDGPYSGISLWQDRTSTVNMLIEGNGNFSLQGTVYAAQALINVNGNGKTSGGDITGWFYDDAGNKIAGSSRVAGQLVAKSLALGGNGNVRLDYTENKTGKTRVITLVE